MEVTLLPALWTARVATPSLVSGGAWERLRAVAASLPAQLARGLYLECRLGSGEEPVDLIVRVERTGGEIIAGRNPRIGLDAHLRDDPVWRRIARLCTMWAEDPMLHAAIRHLWLEFDLGTTGSPRAARVLRPSVFIALEQQALAPTGSVALPRVLDAVLHWLAPDGGMPPGDRAALHAAIGSLAPGEVIPYVGVMLSRDVPAVRLYLAGAPLAGLPARLAAAGWPGGHGELAALLAAVGDVERGGVAELSMAHLDFSGGVLPRVGMEFRFARRSQLRGELAEAAFLDALVRIGLCTGTKRDGLLAWPGHEIATLPDEIWPSVIARRVNCVKIVHAPGLPPEAKGYLLTSWQPVPSRWGRARAAARQRRSSPASIE